jgi:AraC-like DNA-binding protein
MSSVDASPQFSPVRLWLPPWGLHACLRAVMWRSTVGMGLTESQRWGHFPAGPVCTISGLHQGRVEVLASGAGHDPFSERQAAPRMSVMGPQSGPRSAVYSAEAEGVMLIFYPDAFWAMTGVPPQTLGDQIVDAHGVLPAALLAVCERLFEAGDIDQGVQRFLDGLLPIWQQRAQHLTDHQGGPSDWGQNLAPWMEALAMRAAATGWGRSLRQSERRIKQWTGWSLRKLQGSVRGEAAFFAVMEAMLEERVDWAQIALDNGFSDQSHFIRETRRITGFSPEALRHGFNHEEAFWVYRAWAQLAGYAVPVGPEVLA